MKQKNQWILASMALSLCLLALFLGFWLQNTYKEAYHQLETETNLMFVSSIRELEDSLLRNRFFLHETEGGIQSISINIEEEPGTFSPFDSQASGFSFWTRREFKDSNEDTFIVKAKSHSIAHVTEESEKEIQGTISLFLKSTSNPSQGDTSIIFTQDRPFVELLSQKLEKQRKGSDLPLDFKIVQNKQIDSLHKSLSSSRYLDVISNEKYAMSVNEHRGYLLKKLLPQFSFALLLFGSVAWAFGMSYQGLRKQQRLAEIKNDFISNVTHELKTPITTVGVAIEALRDFGTMRDPHKTAEYLDISQQELNRLSILVDKVLKMSVFERKGMPLKIEQIDMLEMAEEILSSMKLQVEKYHGQVNLSINGANFLIQGDKVHLTNVLYNLLDNALKYSKERPQVDIDLQDVGDQVIINLQDNGIGIEPAYHDKIFERFFRVPTGSQHNVKGHGLGLSYVASVIEAHKGNIELKSEIGEGTQFRITLAKSDGQ